MSVRGSRGSIVIMLVMMLSLLAMLPVAMQMMRVQHQQTQRQASGTAQAENIARAGLVDAVAWFRRQPVQPVRASIDPIAYPYADAAFFPRSSTDTAVNDTIDEAVGLVKEYPIGEASWLYARYEVRRQADPASNPYDASAAHDITAERVDGAAAGEGLAWAVTSRGYVYRRKDPNAAFDQAPNEIVARARARVEIRRMALNLPVNAALISSNRQQATLTSNAKVVGGGAAGYGYYTGNNGPTVVSGSSLTGTPTTIDIDGGGGGPLTLPPVFGVTAGELKLMADFSVTDVSELPAEYPAMAIVFVDGNATFNSSRQLRGGGVLVVDGNLTIASNSNCLFSGLIYVTGNATINGPALISGAVLVEGNVNVNGSGDVAEIDYDEGILNAVRQQVVQYRENRATEFAFTSGQ